MSTPLYETKAQPAAPFLAGGVAASLVGWPLLGAVAYLGFQPEPHGSADPLAFLGWLLVLGGAVLTAIGVYRLVQHADRASGVRFTRDPQDLTNATRWTTAQAADVIAPGKATKAPDSAPTE